MIVRTPVKLPCNIPVFFCGLWGPIPGAHISCFLFLDLPELPEEIARYRSKLQSTLVIFELQASKLVSSLSACCHVQCSIVLLPFTPVSHDLHLVITNSSCQVSARSCRVLPGPSACRQKRRLPAFALLCHSRADLTSLLLPASQEFRPPRFSRRVSFCLVAFSTLHVPSSIKRSKFKPS